MSLTRVYDQISSQDQQILEKQAEFIKVAEEEDAAGRIMARGFADELNKLAMPMMGGGMSGGMAYGHGGGHGGVKKKKKKKRAMRY